MFGTQQSSGPARNLNAANTRLGRPRRNQGEGVKRVRKEKTVERGDLSEDERAILESRLQFVRNLESPSNSLKLLDMSKMGQKL